VPDQVNRVPTLELISKPYPGRFYPLDGDVVKIGRDPCSDIHLEDKRVSSVHARILRRSDEDYLVEDLKSYNATFLEGRLLTPFAPEPLRDGSLIRICDFSFVFHREAVAVREGGADETTILGTLDDLSSSGIAARAVRAHVVLGAVLEINKMLGGTIELTEVLGKALDGLFTIYPQAECGFILTLEPDGSLSPRAARNREKPGNTLTLSRSVLNSVIRQGKGLIISDVRAGSEVLVTESLSGSGIRTALCVPLPGRGGDPIGIIQLDSRLHKVTFNAEDLEMLAAVAVPIGVVVENHRFVLERTMLTAAAEVQAALLPRRRPSAPGYTYWDRYLPALEVGGDYFDYIPVEQGDDPGGRLWAVAVADVCGKGMPAALLMANLCAEVRHLARSGAGPAEVAMRINRQLFDADIPGRFITFLLMTVDSETHQLTVANAGHMCPLIRRAGGALEEVGGDEAGMPLGVLRDTVYGTAVTELAPGDVVVLYTDGVTDAEGRDRSLFGTAALRTTVAATAGGPGEVGEAILRAVRSHSGGRPQSDDIAVVCFGRV